MGSSLLSLYRLFCKCWGLTDQRAFLAPNTFVFGAVPHMLLFCKKNNAEVSTYLVLTPTFIIEPEKAVSLISQIIITLVGLISIWDRLNGKK